MLHQALVAAGLPCVAAAGWKGRVLGADESNITRGSQRGPLLVTYWNTGIRTKRWLSKNIQIMKVDEQHRTTWELGTSMSPPTEQATAHRPGAARRLLT